MIRPRPGAFKPRSAPPPDDAVRANETAIDQVACHSSSSSTGGSQGRGEPPIATRQDFRGEGVKVPCEVVGSGRLEGGVEARSATAHLGSRMLLRLQSSLSRIASSFGTHGNGQLRLPMITTLMDFATAMMMHPIAQSPKPETRMLRRP
jgi:hypothetical protein